MKKRLLFVVLVFALAFVIGYLFVTRPGQLAPTIIPTPTPIRPVAVEKLTNLSVYSNEPTGVVFSFVGPEPALPSTVPIYRVNFANNYQAVVSQIASSLSINGPSKTIGAGATPTTVWSNETLTLAVDANTFTYLSNGNVLEAQAGSPNVVVLSFLNKYNLLPKKLSLRLSLQKPYQNYEGDLSENRVPSVLLGYEFLLETSYPLLFTGGSIEAITALVDRRGTLRSLSFPFPPESIISTGSKPLVLISTAVNNLNQGKGTLLSIDGEQKNSLEPEPDFTSVSLNALRIAYYLLPDRTSLVPVFILDGVGRKAGASQGVRYLLRATE